MARETKSCVQATIITSLHPCRQTAMHMSIEEVDVVVVGGGAVGLTMAAELNYRGIKTVLFEKNHSTSILAKASSLTSRTMEHYRRLGLEERVQAVALPRDLSFNVSIFTKAVGGHTIFNHRFSSWGALVDNVPGATFPYFQAGASAAVPLRCPQNKLEPLLRAYLESCPDVSMHWGCEVVDVVEEGEGVRVTAECHPRESEQETAPEEKVVRARYVVACDGGSSPVRKRLGVHMYGHFNLTRACTIIFSCPELFTRMKPLGHVGLSFAMCKRVQAVLVNLDGEGMHAAHIILPPTTTDAELQLVIDNADEYVREIVGDFDITIKAVSSYNMHALLSTKFRVGRCFFAGDSAHQWLPSGGLGLNTGISDAADLAWKLEAVLKGYGSEGLLDAYEHERRPMANATKCFALSFGLNSRVVSSLMSTVRPLLSTSPLARYMMLKVMGGNIVNQFTLGSDLVLGFQYLCSPIVLHEYDASSGAVLQNSSSSKVVIPCSIPGCRAPHVPLPDYPSTHDLFGKHFVLLVVGGEESDLEHLRDELKGRGIPFSVHCYPKLPEIVQYYDRKYFLVRPDGVVAWRADYQPSDVEAVKMADTVLGFSAPKRVFPPPPPPPTPSSARLNRRRLLFDVMASTVSTYLLLNYSEFSFAASIGAGLGVFWLLRGLRTRPMQPILQTTSRYKAVVCERFGPADQVLKIEPRFVTDFGPKDVLVHVHAASINPIDLSVREGYGATMFKVLSKQSRKNFFPIVLGRDCSGEVIAVGDEVRDFTPGDQVYGSPSWSRQGTHAELVTLHEGELALKPDNVTHKEAAAFPWVAGTVWTALVTHAGLTRVNARGKKVLVHAGTGGVGSFAIQFLKAWGAHVTTTCSQDNIPLAHHLGADKAIDYASGDFSALLHEYDIVLDTVGWAYERPSLSMLKWHGGAAYVSLVSPASFFSLKLGSFFGQLVFSAYYRFKVALNRLVHGRAFHYSVAAPTAECLHEVSVMVEKGEIRPVIEAVYSMDEIVAAHKHVEAGHTRGKVVVTMV